MLGFMGTVIGMIQAFQKISAVGNLSASLIAGDIQVALIDYGIWSYYRDHFTDLLQLYRCENRSVL